MKRRLAIIGSGDLGQQIAYYAVSDSHFDVVGFFDDYKEKGLVVNGSQVLGSSDDILRLYESGAFDQLIVAIGYKHIAIKQALFERFDGKIPFATIVHSTSIIDKTARIGAGTIIYPGCIIDQKTEIGDNTVINVGVCIAHDSTIGRHCFLSPRVAIAGFVRIGDRNVIGINSTIIDNITTVVGTQFGGGSVVIRSIDESGLYVGNPVRFVR